MKGDFSRFGFDPVDDYVAVLMQQGRVQVDADWNEQQAIQRRRLEAAAAALLGPAAVPVEGGGFAVTVAADGGDLLIAPGCIYVDGVRIENRAAAPLGLGEQPHLWPAAGGLAGFGPPAVAGRYLVYLDVWDRHVTALDDPRLLEPALGGADTTTRVQTVWQVRLSPQPVAFQACDQVPTGWHPSPAASGTLSARAAGGGGDGHCVLSPVAGYQGLDNRLYRVEVHRGGRRAGDGGTTATFKWSRDNGIVVTTLEGVAGRILSVGDLGRDEVLGFRPGQWIEILDRRMELAQQHGQLLLIEAIDPAADEITIAASTPLPALDTAAPVKLRRWDNRGAAAAAAGIPVAAGPLLLENGIELAFSAGDYRAGDYWLIPARTALSAETGAIDWPLDGGGLPLPSRPHGVRHRYCPLALVDFNPATGFSAVADADCRRFFAPIARRPAVLRFLLRDGAGQDVELSDGMTVDVDQFERGLRAVLGRDVAPGAAGPWACHLQLMLPEVAAGDGGEPVGLVAGHLPFRPAARVSATGRVLSWIPTPAAMQKVRGSLRDLPTDSRVDDDWELHSSPPGSAAWHYGFDGVQTLNQAWQGGGGAGEYRAMALSNAPLEAGAYLLLLRSRPDYSETTGLVFNYLADDDRLLLLCRTRWTPVGYSGAYATTELVLTRVAGGASQVLAQETLMAAGSSSPSEVAFAVKQGLSGLRVGCCATFGRGDETRRTECTGALDLSGVAGAPRALTPGTRIGAVVESGYAADRSSLFDRLEVVYSDRTLALLPTPTRFLAELTVTPANLGHRPGHRFPGAAPAEAYRTWFWLRSANLHGGYYYGDGGQWGLGAELL